MGEIVGEFRVDRALRASVSMETTCGALLRQLEHIWTEIGENEEDKVRMLQELEMECMLVYRRKVDEGSDQRAQLHRTLVAKEAELAALMASLGENSLQSKMEKKHASLKDKLSSVTPLLEDLRVKKDERIRQFFDIQSQIEKISAEIKGYDHRHETLTEPFKDEHDLSMRRLTECQTQLRNLQKEKSDRLHKVLEYMNEVHFLCGLLGLDFTKTVDEVHPSLHEKDSGKSTNISDSILDGLAQAVLKLRTEKKIRFQKLRETVESLSELWNLMDSPKEERAPFIKVADILRSPENDFTCSGILTQETIKQTEAEVDRLRKLKASRMKELVLKKRSELEEICRNVHIEADMSTAPEKSIALMHSGLLDPSELLAKIEAQIVAAKEESLSRKEIMDRVGKWLAACEEENWLEEYNLDQNRYSSGRGAHLNLKRAEKARMIVNKIPDIIDNLVSKTFAWEEKKNMPFLYDGVRLVAVLEEYKLNRLQKDEEKRRYRQDQKRLQNLLLREKDYGSKPSPRRVTSGNYPNGNGFMTPKPRRVSVGSATPELLTPRSYSGRDNGYFRGTRRLSTTPLNFVSISREDNMSSFASVNGSERGSPPRH